MWKGNIPKDSPSGWQLPIHIDKCYKQGKGDALSCGLARPHVFISGKPIQVTSSHGLESSLVDAVVIPRQAGLSLKVLSPEKSVLGTGHWYLMDQQATVLCA